MSVICINLLSDNVT